MYKTSCIWLLLVLLTRIGWAVERPVTRQGFLDPTQIFLIRNGIHGEGYGVELAADWQPFGWWRVSGVYAYLHLNLTRDQGSLDISTGRSTEGSSPTHQFSLRSFMTLPGHVDFDLVWRYVDSLPSQDISGYPFRL